MRAVPTSESSVVSAIVCFNDAERVARLCEVLTAQAPCSPIVVIDHSGDASRRDHAPAYARIATRCTALILEVANRGSAGGFRRSQDWALDRGAAFVWLHDQDGSPEPHCLQRLLRQMESASRLAVVAPVVLDERGFPQHEFCALRGPLGLPRLVAPPGEHAVRPVDYVASAGMLVRVAALRQVGAYDDVHYFVGGEDFDFCARVRHAGWHITVVGAARYHHPHLLRKRGHPWIASRHVAGRLAQRLVRRCGIVNLSRLLPADSNPSDLSALRGFRHFVRNHGNFLAWPACVGYSRLRALGRGGTRLRRALHALAHQQQSNFGGAQARHGKVDR